MALDTYDNLKLEIAEWIDRDDLDDQIDTFIDLAEARISREVRTRAMLVRDTAFAIAINIREIAFPSGFNDIKNLRLKIPNTTVGRRYYKDFDYITEDEMEEQSVNDICRPTSYTVHTQIEFNSETDQAYTGELLYYAKLTPLSGAAQTNSLLTDAPDVYLFGALAATAPFLLHDDRVQLWEGLYGKARDDTNLAEIRSKHPGPLVAKVTGIPGTAAK